MDPPSLILVPPTPQPVRTQQPSPLSTNTIASASSVPELTPSAADRERSSSETTIVTIYSMYEEEVGSWSASDSPLGYDHRRRPSKDVAVTIASLPDYRDSFHDTGGGPIEDSGFYDTTYDVMHSPGKQRSMATGRISVLSDDSTQLAYSNSRPTSSYVRSSSGTRLTSDYLSEGPRRSQVLSADSDALSSTRSGSSSSRPVSQHRTNSSSSRSSPPTAAGSPNCSPRVSNASPRLSPRSLSTVSSLSPDSEPPLSPPLPPLPRPDSSPLLTVPSTPPTSPPRRTPKIGSPGSKLSQISLVPSDGEDPDSFHVRSTYAQLDLCGVKRDGTDEGVERTRARVGGSRASELKAEEALADENEKLRDLTPDEIRMLGSLDRYGFYVTPSHERLILLPAAPLQKPLSRVTTAAPSTPPNAPLLRSQPQSPPPTKEHDRTAKWGRMLIARSRDEGGNIDLWDVKPKKEHKLRERTFKGIPDCWRSAAWEVLMNRFTKTGKRELKELAAEYRTALDLPSTYDVQIDLDVPRTISGHVMFRTRYGQGQRSLFHVLHCLSLRCETCGYCQGMGPIAATLLCYFEPERVYASLVRIHDAYAMHDVFQPGFPGLLEAIYVQERVMEQMMPDVYAAFKRHMISTTSYATKWYITLFANSVPFQAQLRLWDAFLLEGHDVFVIVAVAIVWVYREHITSTHANFESVLSLLSSFFVPEDENAVLTWIEKVAADKKLRASMQQWRQDWKRLVAEGKQGSALL